MAKLCKLCKLCVNLIRINIILPILGINPNSVNRFFVSLRVLNETMRVYTYSVN